MNFNVKEQIDIALKLHQSGNLVDAEKLYSEILKEVPDNVSTLNLLGLLKLQNQQFDDSIVYIKKALELSPCAYFWESLGRAYLEKEDFQEAINCYKKSLELDPNSYYSIFNLALAYKKDNQIDKAIETYNLGLENKPDSIEIYNNLANIYESKNDTLSAMKCYEKALEYSKDDKNINYFLGLTYLKLKNFEKGWKFCEKHRTSKDCAILTQELQYKDLMTSKPLWHGEQIEDKTIFVYYESGLGDTLMFARYLSALKDKCKKILFKPQLCFIDFFKENNFGCEIIDINTRQEDMLFDVHIPLLSLPYYLNLRSEKDIPFTGGYFKANLEKTKQYKENYFNNNKFKIGIKWQGNTIYNLERIIPLKAFYKLLKLPNTVFYSVQKGSGSEELESLPKKYELINLGETFNNFSDTAAAVKNFDLIICNDTSIAHLAGAMGKPCWILLPFSPNWRWHTDISYCTWYKSVKLFKQNEPDNWDEVFDRVYDELTNIIP